jgi:hypothetical protein
MRTVPNVAFLLLLGLASASALVLAGCAKKEGKTMPQDAAVANAAPAVPCVYPDAGPPDDVFCTGLYAQHNPTKYEADVMPYTPGVTLWSDGADKKRYLQLPKGAQIDTSDMDTWKFPPGTKAWKEFRFNGKLVETRFFWKQEDGNWFSGTYIWDDTGKTATLNTSRQATILDTGYEIPTQKDCDKCHHGGADHLLGIEAVALSLPTAEGVTLAKLVAAGSLSAPPAKATATLPEDSTGKAAAALGYLHANCGMPCHSTRGLGEETKLVLRLRAAEVLGDAGGAPASVAMTDLYRATVNQMPTTASVAQAFPGDNRITPGSHDNSLLWQLSHRRGKYQMPPLVSHKVDDVGTQKLADWIDALTP